MVLGNCPKRDSLQKWLGEGAKGLFDSFGPSWSKGLPRVFCTTQTLFCTGATPFRTSARGLLLAGSKRPFAPSPNHFRELSLFRQFPRSAASQPEGLISPRVRHVGPRNWRTARLPPPQFWTHAWRPARQVPPPSERGPDAPCRLYSSVCTVLFVQLYSSSSEPSPEWTW